MRTIKTYMFYFLLAIILTGCSDATENQRNISSDSKADEATDKLQAGVVNYPLQYFVQQIGHNDVDVIFPVKQEDPAFWKPDSNAVRKYQSADIIFLNGANYARWLSHASLPEDKLVNTSESFSQNYISLEHDVKHTHGPKGAHSHGALAFTTWLDMQQAIQQADKIRETLIALKPEQKDRYNKNYQQLVSQLKHLDEQFTRTAEKLSDTPVIFSHPVYQYFQRAYAINAISVHWEPDAIVDEEAWTELSRKNSEHGAQWMIWEATPLPETLARLQIIGIQSIVLNPAASKLDNSDFITIIQGNLQQLMQIQ